MKNTNFSRIILGTLLSTFVSSMALADQAAFTLSLPATVNAADQTKVKAFFDDLQKQIPAPILKRLVYALSSDGKSFDVNSFKAIQIEFVQFQGESAQITAPSCDLVDSFDKADQIKKEFRQIVKSRNTGDRIRFDGQLDTVVVGEGRNQRIVLNAGFLPIIINGESKAQTFNCGHGNLFRMAQASVIHGLARILDSERFFSREEEGYLDKKKGACAPVYEYPGLKNLKERIDWTNEALYCVDLMESNTLISERNRYRIISGGWEKDDKAYTKVKQAFWPRSVNRFAYAYDSRTHFAYHFEQYILDKTFACRLPNLHEYLTEKLSIGNESADRFQSVKNGICEVNMKVRVADDYTDEEGQPFFNIDWYDLNPKNVQQIDYYRAGSGQAAMSLFGHTMYRVRGKNGTALVENCSDMSDEYKIGPCDLIINHRANPTELKLDQVKGFFGGYPSQLLVSPAYDIMYEYGDSELRHIYNLPLGHKTKNGFEMMPEDEKTRFLNATVEQFWAYVGNYKFVSNNCADEALRLYQNATLDPRAGYVNVLTPKSIDQSIFKKLDAVRDQDLKNSEEPGLIRSLIRKVFGRTQKGYVKERRRIEKNPLIDVSKRYNYYDALSEIIRLEGRKNSEGKTVDPKNINVIEDEAKVWGKLGKVSKDAKSICKINEQYATVEAKKSKVNEVLQSVFNRYDVLVANAKTRYAREKSETSKQYLKDIFDNFFIAFYHAEISRQKDLSDMSVSIAYEIARPDNGKEMMCKGERAWRVDEARKKEIEKTLEAYEAYEEMTQPYSNFSILPGYGIPLKNEVRPDEVMETFAQAKRGQVGLMMLFLSPELGIDYDVYRGIREKRYEICKDRIAQGLYVGEGVDNTDKDGDPDDCDTFFEDVVLNKKDQAKK